MAHIVNKTKDCAKRHKRVTLAIILIGILIIVFWAFFMLVPHNSIIYYSGNAEDVRLDMSAKMLQIDVQDDPYNGIIRFYGESELSDSIWAIDQALLEEIPLEKLDLYEYMDDRTFLFNDGTATLDCTNYLELTMESPDDSDFTYSISITREDSGNGYKNLITIDNFPENTIIYVRGESEIGMYGNISNSHINAGRYRMMGCRRITFSPYSKSLQPIENKANEPDWSNVKVLAFQFTNIKRETFEFTVDSSTEFKEIGHIVISGVAKSDGDVSASISDMGAYPILLTLSGSVEELSMAGHSFYLTYGQWLRMNMTPILLALISVIFSAILAIPSQSSD